MLLNEFQISAVGIIQTLTLVVSYPYVVSELAISISKKVVR